MDRSQTFLNARPTPPQGIPLDGLGAELYVTGPNWMNPCVYSTLMRHLFLVFLFAPIGLSAQHCGYDFRSVIVVRPHAAGDSAVIDGLRITLLDSNNVPVVHYDKPRQLFHRNVEKHLPYGKRGHFDVPAFFPFAKDNYILVMPNSWHAEKMKLLVQDERDAGPLNKRRDRWPVRYKQVVVPLTAFDSYPLCGRFDEEVYPPMEGRPNFAPVDITLYPR
jgi:hypothetical protein